MKKKIVSSFGLTLLSSGFFFGFNFFLAKFLGANFYGEISYYLSFIQIVALLISFDHPALYMGNKISKGDSNTFSLFITIESLMFLIILIPVFFIILKYVKSSEITFLILFIAYFLTLISTVGLEFNSKKQVSKSIFYSSFFPRLLLIIMFLISIFFAIVTPKTYLYLYLFSLILVVGYFLYYFRPKFYIKKEIFKRVWKFYLLGIIGSSFLYIAQIFQKQYGSYKELASLSIALLFIAGLGLVGAVLIKFALPKLHEFWKAKDISNISTLYITHTFLSSIINLPILIFLMFFIDIISKFMGSGYSSLPTVFYILSIGYIFDLLTGITGTILRVTENEHIEIYNEIFRFGLGMGLLFILKNQGYGVAWAISASMIIYNIAKFFQVYRLFKIKPLTLNYFKYLILLLVSLVFMFYIVAIIANNIVYKIVLSILIMLIFYTFSYKMSKKILNLNINK